MYSGKFVDEQHHIVRSPEPLKTYGAFVIVKISLSKEDIRKKTELGLPIPDAIEGAALLDTGTNHTAVDEEKLKEIGIEPSHKENIETMIGKEERNIYRVNIRVADEEKLDFELSRVAGIHLTSRMKFLDHPVIAIIGRDILSKCVFIYNGIDGTFQICT